MRKQVYDARLRSDVVRALASGKITLAEAGRKAGVSPQLARQWALMAHVNWKLARQNHVDRMWRIVTGQDRADRLDKRKLRETADQAKREWDERHNGAAKLE